MPVPLSTNVGTFIEQTTKPRSTSPVAWWALVGISPVQIVPGGGGRAGLFFHNPGSVNLLFLPGALDGNGNAILAGSNQGAGSLLVSPSQFIYVGQESPIGNSIFVVAVSGSNNPATIWEFL